MSADWIEGKRKWDNSCTWVQDLCLRASDCMCTRLLIVDMCTSALVREREREAAAVGGGNQNH